MNNLVFLEPSSIKETPFTTSDVIAESAQCPNGMKRVYVLASKTGLVKIGVTGEFTRRKRTLETQSGFEMDQEHFSPPLTNYSEIEHLSHDHFRSRLKLGEWFEISFDEAVSFIVHLCSLIGDHNPPERRLSYEPLFKLPTAMEEEAHKNPALHSWLVKNELELYWTDGSAELRVRGTDFDLPFDLFAKIAINGITKSRQCY